MLLLKFFPPKTCQLVWVEVPFDIFSMQYILCAVLILIYFNKCL